MKNTLMGTEIVPTEGFHLVQKLYSFLDIPGRSPGHLQSTDLGKGSKEGSEVRAGPTVRKFGRQFCWQEELANARYGVSPLVALETRAVERPQGAAQCGDLVGLSEAFSPQWGEAGQPSDSDCLDSKSDQAKGANCRFKRRMEVSPFQTEEPPRQCQASCKPSANGLGFFRVSAPDWKVGRSSPFPKSRNPGVSSTKRVRLVTMVDTGKSGIKSDLASHLNPSDQGHLKSLDSGYFDLLNARFRYRSSDEYKS